MATRYLEVFPLKQTGQQSYAKVANCCCLLLFSPANGNTRTNYCLWSCLDKGNKHPHKGAREVTFAKTTQTTAVFVRNAVGNTEHA